jgi:hypothetical protein
MIERLERPARCLIAIVALAIGLTTAGAVRATTSDLSVEGVYYFQVTGNTVVISIDKVTNITVPPRISGELSLELWAFRVPYQGLGQEGYQQDGYRLASYPMGRLSPGSFLFGVNSGSIAYTPPPPGTWYLTLLVVEYDGSAINFGGLSPRAFFNFGRRSRRSSWPHRFRRNAAGGPLVGSGAARGRLLDHGQERDRCGRRLRVHAGRHADLVSNFGPLTSNGKRTPRRSTVTSAVRASSAQTFASRWRRERWRVHDRVPFGDIGNGLPAERASRPHRAGGILRTAAGSRPAVVAKR